jgi:hypothetical protein
MWLPKLRSHRLLQVLRQMLLRDLRVRHHKEVRAKPQQELVAGQALVEADVEAEVEEDLAVRVGVPAHQALRAEVAAAADPPIHGGSGKFPSERAWTICPSSLLF